MTRRAWLAETIGVVAFVTLAVVATNWSVDFFGIFRGARGAHIAAYGDVRTAKYLLSEKYVPDNFNSLLVGSSVSGNWDGRGLTGLRLYNESLNGGNIVEEKAIADQALASSQIRIVILLIFPYMTMSHDFKTVVLNRHLNNEALGSVNLEETYKQKIRESLHLDKPECDAWGVYDYSHIPNEMNANEKRLMTPGKDFVIDATAMQTYRDLEAELHARNIPIIYLMPPFKQSLYAGKPEALRKYADMVLVDKVDRDRVIDFNSDEFASFRNTSKYFLGVHLTNEAGHEVVAVINSKVNEWIRNGQLPNLNNAILTPAERSSLVN